MMWAVATRSDPATSIDIIQRGMGSKNDPMYVAYPYKAAFSSKAIIDACRPYDHLDEFPGCRSEQGTSGKGPEKWKDLFGSQIWNRRPPICKERFGNRKSTFPIADHTFPIGRESVIRACPMRTVCSAIGSVDSSTNRVLPERYLK